MADLLNCERLQGVLAAHELSDSKKLTQQGFLVQQQSLLCAAAHTVQSFWAPGACRERLRAELDGRNQVTARHWTPITRREYERLAPLKEPLTGEPHVLFAWMPLPQPQGQTLPQQASDTTAQPVSADKLARQLPDVPQQAPASAQVTEDLLDLDSPSLSEDESSAVDSKDSDKPDKKEPPKKAKSKKKSSSAHTKVMTEQETAETDD